MENVDDDSSSVLRLIEVMSRNPQLYDKSDPGYSKKKSRQNQSWAEVATFVGRSAKYCQHLWCEVLNRFKTELQTRNQYLASGCCFVTEWPYYEKMLYMEHQLDLSNCSLTESAENMENICGGRWVTANCGCHSSSDSCNSQNSFTESLDKNDLSNCENKANPQNSLELENQRCVCNAGRNGHNPDQEMEQYFQCSDTEIFRTGEKSSDWLFAKLIACMLKDIPSEEIRDDVKLHIMEVIIRAKRMPLQACNEMDNMCNRE